MERGRDGASPDLQDRFGPGDLVGLGRTRFALASAGLEYDGRGWDGLWRTGFRAGARGQLYRGVDGTPTDFGVWEVEVAALLPVTSRQHLTLRGWGRGTEADGTGVPFTHLPALGGGETLRSYESGRFRDRAALAGSVEWRWELWRDLRERARVHALLFLDGGAAAASISDLSDPRSSVGVGLGGRWLRGAEAAGWIAFGEEGARISGAVRTEVP